MNIVFGRVGRGAGAAPAEWAARLEGAYRQPVTWRADADDLCVGTLDDGGVVLGTARRGSTTLACIGNIHHPLPGFTDGTPLDDPHRTAAFLLDRFLAVGRACLDDVQGSFAIAILDEERRHLLLAAGPGGLRNLMVAERDGTLVFATSLAGLVAGLGDTARVDRSLEDFLLIYGFLPFNRLPFQGARILAPGAGLEWRDGRSAPFTIRTANPWAARLPRVEPSMSFDDGVERLYDVFMGAMEDLAASTPQATVLLGGFDSGLVAAGLARLGRKVTTWSFGYGDPRYDQPHTDTLSQFLRSDHRWVRIDADAFRAGMDAYGLRYSALSNWPNYIIQTDLVCAAMRGEGFLHCYTGDGCDHTFMGYPRVYGRARLYDAFGRMSPLMSRAAIALLHAGRLERGLGHPWRVALNVLRTLGGEWPAGRFLTFRIFDELSLERLRLDRPPQEKTPLDILREMTRDLGNLSPARLAYHGKTIIGTNRTKIIGASDGNGISILSPYLHPAVKAFALGIPDEFVRPRGGSTMTGSGKYILMQMAERKQLLPPAFIHQRKIAAVDAPIDEWYFGPLRSWARERLRALPFDADDTYVEHLLRPKLAERLYREHVSSDHLTTHGLSLLLTYAAIAGLANADTA